MPEETKRGSNGGKARSEKLSKEDRSRIAKEAAQRRWSKKKDDPEPVPVIKTYGGPGATATVEITGEVIPVNVLPLAPPIQEIPPQLTKKTRVKPMPKAFKGASSYAEKRLVEALKERGECMGRLGALNVEIPSLVQVIRALGGTQVPLEALQAYPPAMGIYPSPDMPYMQPQPFTWPAGQAALPQMPPVPNLDPGLFQANAGPVPGTPALSPAQLIPGTSAGGAMDLDYVPRDEDEGGKLPNMGGQWV